MLHKGIKRQQTTYGTLGLILLKTKCIAIDKGVNNEFLIIAHVGNNAYIAILTQENNTSVFNILPHQ